MNKTNNEYEVLFNLVKEALKFYADEDNYKNNNDINNELVSKIEIDNGHQARFTLKQIKLIEEANQEYENDFIKNLSPELDTSNDKLKKLIEGLKKEAEKYDDIS